MTIELSREPIATAFKASITMRKKRSALLATTFAKSVLEQESRTAAHAKIFPI
jgi:hypothetical protein